MGRLLTYGGAAVIVLAAASICLTAALPAQTGAAAPPSAELVSAGAAAFHAKCSVCHSISPSGGPSVGPNLSGVVGRHAGSEPGFRYSPAMSNADLVWSEDNLRQYIANPGAVVPGNHMPFAGDRDAGEVDAIVAYLATLN